MEITKSQKRLLIILGIVICYAIFDFVTHKDEYLSYYLDKETPKKSSIVKKPVDSTAVAVNRAELNIENWGRDPFRDMTKKVVRRAKPKPRRYVPTFRLEAISYRDGNSIALINDRILRKGDKISGYRVMDIGSERVVLSNSKNRIVLKLEKF